MNSFGMCAMEHAVSHGLSSGCPEATAAPMNSLRLPLMVCLPAPLLPVEPSRGSPPLIPILGKPAHHLSAIQHGHLLGVPGVGRAGDDDQPDPCFAPLSPSHRSCRVHCNCVAPVDFDL